MNNNLKLGLEVILLTAGLSACIPEQEVRKDNISQTIQSAQQEAKKEQKNIICQWFQGRENLVLKEYKDETLGNELEDGSIKVYSLDGTPVIDTQYGKGAGISTSRLAEGKYHVIYQSGNEVYKTKFILDRGMK
jgi:hypothetical protein